MKTPDYVHLVGFMDQTLIDLTADGYAGECNPHATDSAAWSNGNNNSYEYEQVIRWHNFMGASSASRSAILLTRADPPPRTRNLESPPEHN